MTPTPTPTALVVSYLAPAGTPTGGLAVTVVETSTGRVWSPSLKGFSAAAAVAPVAAPTDSLILLTLVGGPNHPLTYVAVVPGVPDPSVEGGIAVYVPPAAGGPPVDPQPMVLPIAPTNVPKGMSFALIVQGP